MVSATHTLHRRFCHHVWDRTLVPVLTVAPGAHVTFDVTDASSGQITRQSTASVFDNYNSKRVNPVNGPVFVDGAEPGDVLVVKLESYVPSGWGWTAIIPGFGLLADEFLEPVLLHWDYDRTGKTPLLFGDHARIPLAPFAGTIGLAPSAPGQHSIIPPRRVGGNLDVRDLVAGSVLFLPVEVPGALLSIGDTHAAQGDGEVCGTAIESPMQVSVTLDLIKDHQIRMPRIDRPSHANRPTRHGRIWITTGIGRDLHAAARVAVREMIDLVGQQIGLAREDAYMICSVVGDLKISQIVDAPNWTVSFHLPAAIFD